MSGLEICLSEKFENTGDMCNYRFISVNKHIVVLLTWLACL